jgi:polyphosphate kinase
MSKRRSVNVSPVVQPQTDGQPQTNRQPQADGRPIDLAAPDYYFNRELSWINFNLRVLQEALDQRTPLMERLKFLAIFSANLDEFFMVRIAALKEQVTAGVLKRSIDGQTPQRQLTQINDRLHPIVTQQHEHFERVVRPELAQNGVHLLDYDDLDQAQQDYLHDYFETQAFPVLTPLAIDPGHPFPYISNLALSLAVVIRDPESGAARFARVKVPKVLPRFVIFPPGLRYRGRSPDAETPTELLPIWVGVPLEQVVAHNLPALFPGMEIQAYHPFRVTRNADLEVEEDEADDLMEAIEQELNKRRVAGSVVRVEMPTTMPPAFRALLMDELAITDRDIYEVDTLLCLRDLMDLMDLPLPHLKDRPWKSATHPRLKQTFDLTPEAIAHGDVEVETDIFSVIRKQDLLLHHPYQSFSSSVQRFVEDAAQDPDVLTIKMTLYRTSGDSPIVKALIKAAENGKQVAALVELKARFDEANNILWAKRLESAGVHVVYGLVGLKTHTKLVLVVRREAGQIQRYVHVGTGNYNPKTARLYTDLGILTCHPEIGADVTDLFNALTGYSRQSEYRQLLVAPVNLRQRMLSLIDREIQQHRQQGNGRIIAKMNALVDARIIQALYQASQAGVEIDLIVRGVCCLRPGLPGISETIRVMSIVGRFLEHSRIFYFHNGGTEELYIGSADWMNRNLDRRVEAVTPILDQQLAAELQQILAVMLADRRYAWELQADGQYLQRQPTQSDQHESCQATFMEWARPNG